MLSYAGIMCKLNMKLLNFTNLVIGPCNFDIDQPEEKALCVGRSLPTVLKVELLLSFSPFFPAHIYGKNSHNLVIHLTEVRPYPGYCCACKHTEC